MIDVKTMNRTEAIFTLIKDGVQHDFAVDRLIAHCLKTKLEAVRVAVDPEFASWCVHNRGVENHRLERFTAKMRRFPVIFLDWPDGTKLLVDGTHRYVWAALHGKTLIKAWILSENEWKPFVVAGLCKATPDRLLRMFSGIM